MQDDVSHAPRRLDAISPAALLFNGVPKGTVVMLLAVAAWFIAAMAIAGLWWAATFLATHWPL